MSAHGSFGETAEMGLPRAGSGPPSQIVVLRTAHAQRIASQLRQRGIRATALGDRIRFGFHYFNNDQDVTTTLRALERAVASPAAVVTLAGAAAIGAAVT